MNIGKYLVLVGLSLVVACGNPPPTVTLTASELNPGFNSSVTFTATAAPAGKITKLELLEGDTVLRSVGGSATLEHPVIMTVAGKRSFKARVTDSAGATASSAVIEVNTNSLTTPVVTLKASPDQLFVDGLSTLTASVTASGGVSEVEFFDGLKSLGKDSSVPFEMVVTDFTTVGSRAFKAVATDTNGLKGEGLTSIAVLASKPTSLQVFINELLRITGNIELILSPDVTELEAKYEAGTVSKQTKWTLLDINSNPASVDGSLGTIVAIPGDPDGLRSAKVRYIPPAIANFNDEIKVQIATTSVQDPTQSLFFGLSIKKKGTQSGIRLVPIPVGLPKINVPIEIQLQPIDSVGNVKTDGVWGVASSRGTLACKPAFQCRFTEQGAIVSRQVIFTPTKLGEVTIGATSLHDGATASLALTVVP
jgi:hypothetical protein